jgi:hypothetical protein
MKQSRLKMTHASGEDPGGMRVLRNATQGEFSVFRVVYDRESEDWKVERQGSFRPLIWTKSKAAAVNAAKKYGQAYGLAQVIVLDKDGSIEEQHDFGEEPPKTRKASAG